MASSREYAMAGKRRTEEEIVAILREAEEGNVEVSEICRKQRDRGRDILQMAQTVRRG